MTEVKTDFVEDVSLNVLRLIKDATYLRKDERFASAFALALIALEEVGKIVLHAWEEAGMKPRCERRTQHLQKQAAVSCVILAASILPDLRGEITNGEYDEKEAVLRVARQISNRDEGFLHSIAEAGLIDKMKQLALYVDANPLAPGLAHTEFGKVHVDELLTVIKDTLLAINSRPVMAVAKAIFDAEKRPA